MSDGDQVLSLHRFDKHVFELSGLRTGSLRDQTLRAALVVERLHLAGVISDSKPLLVVGGGAAGITAALRASELGVPSELLEQGSMVMGRQFSVRSRLIDPVEYDWPHPHWRAGKLPIRSGQNSMPLAFCRDRASALAADWQLHFKTWCDGIGSYPNRASIETRLLHRVVRSTQDTFLVEEMVHSTPGAGVWTYRGTLSWDDSGVRLQGPSSEPPRRFAAALSCVGFGTEHVHFPSAPPYAYSGPKFWSQDSLDESDMGLKRSPGRIDVVVSGGGDGAQQDIQRALTRRFGRALYEAFEHTDPDFSARFDLAPLLLADDEGRRAHAWSSPHGRCIHTLQRWHDAYMKSTQKIWDSWSETQIDALKASLFRDRVNVHLTWLLGGSVPTFSYGLNRLLTLLVLRLHSSGTGRPLWCEHFGKRNGDKPIVMANTRFGGIKPAPPGHEVLCDSGGKDAAGASRLHHLGDFDIVIIRHGVASTPLFGAAPVPEQIVPFGLPD